jgi:pyruvate/2-oxoglutarate dehydrogenase complex dihydrolipoamide acyltransferase (E2) component
MIGGKKRASGMVEIRLQEISEASKDAVLARWELKEGEYVPEGGVIAEIVTDKASFDVLAPVNGVLLKRHKKAGEKITVGGLIAEMEEAGDPLRQQT